MSLLDLPQEILSNILRHLEPLAIVRFGQTCSTAYSLSSPVHQLLWRSSFLQIYDDPEHAWSLLPSSKAPPRETWDWFVELRRRQIALRVLHTQFPPNDDDFDPEEHVSAILSIIDTARPGPSLGKLPEVDDRSSLNLQHLANSHEYFRGLDRLIHHHKSHPESSSASDFELTWPGRPMTRARASATRTDSRSEAISRLHTLHGLTYKERSDHKLRGQARRKVYDWSLTSSLTDYGPFLPPGHPSPSNSTINWSLLEGAMTTISHNFEMCIDGHLSIPSGFCYSIPHRTLIPPSPQPSTTTTTTSQTPDSTTEINPVHDWARVEGPYLGTYAFLNYSHLFAYNQLLLDNGTRLSLDDDPEACGDILTMNLKIVPPASSDYDRLRNDARLATKIPYDPDPRYPPLFFRGSSRGQSLSGSPLTAVKGFAALLPGGREVRWKFIISYSGSDAWQLEGVQPGGIRSGGIYGVWSQVEHEALGAVGPFGYWPGELVKGTELVVSGS